MRITKQSGVALLCVVSFALAGCATPRQAFNKEAHADIKRIGLLEPAASGEYLIQNFGHPGGAFGLIGGLIAAAHMQSQSTEFTVQARDTKLDVVGELTELIRARLTSGGYDVKLIKPQREKPALLEKYDGLDGDVDAYLDPVLIFAGYFTASAVSDYLPAVRLTNRLVKRKTGEILYTEIISYGYQLRGPEVVNIASDPRYRFANFSDLKADPALAVEGIRAGLPLIARQVAADLKASGR